MKIKELRKENRITQVELAKTLGITQASLSMWETGKCTPDIDSIYKMCKIFGCSMEYLIGKEDAQKNTPKVTTEFAKMPVIGDIAAGFEKEAIESWSGETVDVPFSYFRGRSQDDFFVLKVRGASMYPLYHDGDYVLILKQETANYSGQVCAIMYGDNATLKKIEYAQGENWVNMIPVNPEYQPKKLTGEELEMCRVLGIPKATIRFYE